MELEPKDYELLKFIADNPDLSEDQIIKSLKGKVSGIYHRLSVLAEPRNSYLMNFPYCNPPKTRDDYYVWRSSDQLLLSSKGYAKLQDWLVKQNQKNEKVLETRLWNAAPYIVSFAALLKSFWPDIISLWQSLKP